MQLALTLMGARKIEMIMIPELFVCPISLELMSDPVTLLATAQTYDRPNIHRWIAAGHRTCPVTMQTLPLPHHAERLMVPNRTLKHLIDRWLLTGRDLSLSDLALPALRDNLQLQLDGDPCCTATTVETLRIFRSLSPPGFCPLLLRLLLAQPQGRPSDDQHAAVVELAVDCLLASPSTHELASALQEKTNVESSFALLLRQGSLKVKTGLCRLIEIVAAAKAVMVLGQTEPVMGALAGLVQDNGNNAAASHAALRAMSGLCSSDQASRETAVAAGAVDALISYISSGTGTGTGRKSAGRVCLCLALETLELVLINVEDGRQAMYTNPGATAALVKMVFRVPSDQGGSEHAVGSLLVTCRESAAVRVDAINAGVLTQLLLLLQSQCSPKAKANARALLKLLRALCARD